MLPKRNLDIIQKSTNFYVDNMEKYLSDKCFIMDEACNDRYHDSWIVREMKFDEPDVVLSLYEDD